MFAWRKHQKDVGSQRIRGQHIAVLVSHSQGVPAEEGLRKADEKNLVVVSNKRWDKALVGSDEWKLLNVMPALPAWTGTYTGYEEPGKKLGKIIEYADSETGFKHVFPVPQNYQGEKNAILVAEHPDYELELDGNNRVVTASKVDLVRDFPSENGWYLADPAHSIPVGVGVSSSNDDARHLWRIAKRVGPIWRVYDGFYPNHCWRGIPINGKSSHNLGIAVEASEAGAQLEIAGSVESKTKEPKQQDDVSPKFEVFETPDGILVKGITLETFTALIQDALNWKKHLNSLEKKLFGE